MVVVFYEGVVGYRTLGYLGRFFVVENFQHSTDVLGTFMGRSKDIRTYKIEISRVILKKFSLVKSAKVTRCEQI